MTVFAEKSNHDAIQAKLGIIVRELTYVESTFAARTR